MRLLAQCRLRRCSAAIALAAGLLPGLDSASPAGAQVVFDGTVGPGGALAGPTFQVTPERGRQVGGNLVHSFQTFNLAAAERATFSGPPDVARVLARVTGGSSSTIDGTLECAIPGADLYLMNPDGIVFGPKAKLEVQGSFVATSAAFLGLGDGGRFDARTPGNSVLTSGPPTVFGFVGPGAPAGIRIDKRGSNDALLHPRNMSPASLSFIGGDILVLGAATVQDRNSAEDRPARANFIAVGSPGELTFDPADERADPLGLDAFEALADVAFADNAVIEVGSTSNGTPQAGRILIRGDDVSVSASNLRVRSNALDGLGVDVVARGTLSTAGEALVRSSTSGAAAGAPIAITAARLEMAGGHVRSEVDEGATGRGGDISVRVGEMRLTPSADAPAEILATTFGGRRTNDSGRGGDVLVVADRPIQLDAAATQHTRIFTEAGGFGAAGFVRVDAPGAETLDPAAVFSATFASGAAGAVILNGAEQVLPPSVVSLDGTAGGTAGPVARTPDATGPGGTFAIGTDAGVLAGSNLLYSFDRFSLSRQESLVFTGRAGDPSDGAPVSGLRNIIARVTGGSPSTIDGRLRSEVQGSALFLLNPAGVMLGSFARLQIPGSLVLSSASAVRFGNRETFGVGAFAGAPSAGAPTGLEFGDGAGPIVVRGLPLTSGNPDKLITKLGVGVNSVLTLAGGDVSIESRAVVAQGDLAEAGGDPAGAGRVNLLSVASAGSIQFDPSSATSPLQVEAAELGAVRLSDKASVDAGGVTFDPDRAASRGGRGGRVDVRAGSMAMTGGSRISSTSTGGRENAKGLGVEVRTTGDLLVEQSLITTLAMNKSDAGDLTIQARDIEVIGGGGDPLRAFELRDMGLTADTIGEGRGGGVNVYSRLFNLRDGGQVKTTTSGAGDGGTIEISAEHVLLDNETSTEFTVVSAQTTEPFSGNGGNIAFGVDGRLRTFELRGGAGVIAATRGQGDGGTVTIRARGSITLDGTTSPIQNDGTPRLTSIDAVSRPFMFDPEVPGTTHGDGGRIELDTGSLLLRGFAQVNAGTQTSGDGGSIAVRAGLVDLAGIRSVVDETGDAIAFHTRISAGAGRNTRFGSQKKELTGEPIGNSGSIQIRARRMSLRDGGIIETSTSNEGDAGDIDVRVEGDLLMEGSARGSPSGLESRTSSVDDGTVGSGRGGDISVAAENVRMHGGRVITDSRDQGDSGSIRMRARETVEMSNGAVISSGAKFRKGGNVSVSAGRSIDLRDGRRRGPGDTRTQITASADVEDAGSIRLEALGRISLSDAEVTTDAGGRGGDIFMNSFLLTLDGARIIANAVTDDAGNIDIRVIRIEGYDPKLPDAGQSSSIQAHSERGISDDQLVSPADSDIAGKLANLPEVAPGAAAVLAELCGYRAGGDVSSFIVTGRGGAPTVPGGLVPYLPLQRDPSEGRILEDAVDAERGGDGSGQ